MVLRVLIPRFMRSLLGVSLIIVVIGCGKKTENSKGRQMERQTGPVITDLDLFLSKQEVICESGRACPSHITKIAVVHRNTVKFCTGYLTSPYVVATSTSCLSPNLRLNDLNCNKDVHFFFSGNFNGQTVRAGCNKVLQVSQLSGKDAVLWRDDVSFLELERPMRFRRSLHISRNGMENHRSYYVYGIDQVDEHTAFIRRQDCEAIHNTYLNPLTTKHTSPGMVLSGCSFKNGYTGAPILDSEGYVRGSVSEGVSSKVLDFLKSTGLLNEPLKEMFHATNFACAPTLNNTQVADEKECNKDLNYTILDNLRTSMMSPVNLFEDMKIKLEQKISEASRYFEFGVNLVIDGDSRHPEIFPKCFKSIDQWIAGLNTSRNGFSYEATLPQVVFKKSLDGYGRIKALETTGEDKSIFIQFSPKQIKSRRQSTVYMWNDVVNLTFPNITETCK